MVDHPSQRAGAFRNRGNVRGRVYEMLLRNCALAAETESKGKGRVGNGENPGILAWLGPGSEILPEGKISPSNVQCAAGILPILGVCAKKAGVYQIEQVWLAVCTTLQHDWTETRSARSPDRGLFVGLRLGFPFEAESRDETSYLKLTSVSRCMSLRTPRADGQAPGLWNVVPLAPAKACPSSRGAPGLRQGPAIWRVFGLV
jgi:hypothetical protein